MISGGEVMGFTFQGKNFIPHFARDLDISFLSDTPSFLSSRTNSISLTLFRTRLPSSLFSSLHFLLHEEGGILFLSLRLFFPNLILLILYRIIVLLNSCGLVLYDFLILKCLHFFFQFYRLYNFTFFSQILY